MNFAIDWLNSIGEVGRWIIYLAILAVITWSGHWFAQRLNHALASCRDNRNRFETERLRKCSEIREAGKIFWSEISLDRFSNLYGHDLRTAIIQFYEPQNTAKAKFLNVLPESDRVSFNECWDEYIKYRHRHFDLRGLNQHLEKLRKFTDPV